MGLVKISGRSPHSFPVNWYAGGNVPLDATHTFSRRWWNGRILTHHARLVASGSSTAGRWYIPGSQLPPPRRASATDIVLPGTAMVFRAGTGNAYTQLNMAWAEANSVWLAIPSGNSIVTGYSATVVAGEEFQFYMTYEVA